MKLNSWHKNSPIEDKHLKTKLLALNRQLATGNWQRATNDKETRQLS